MKRFLPIFIIFFISCSYGASEELESEILEAVAETTGSITESTFQYMIHLKLLSLRILQIKKQSLFSGLITEAYVDGSYLS